MSNSLGSALRLTPALVAVLLAACSSSTTGNGGGSATLMTAQEANAAADVVVNDILDESEGATATDASTAFFAGSTEAPGGQMALAAAAPWWAICTPAPVRTVSGSTATFVFTNCRASRLVPLESITRNGTVAITRTTGSRSIVFTDFRKDWDRLSFRTGQRVTFSSTRNGTRLVTRDDGSVLTRQVYGATQADAFRTAFVGEDSATGTHLRRWTASFTADTAGTIVRDQPLPTGKYTLNGSSEWSRTKDGATKSWSFQVQTGADGVHYNPACTAAGPSFDRGSLTVVATNRAGETTTLQVAFTGCGAYTVTRS